MRRNLRKTLRMAMEEEKTRKEVKLGLEKKNSSNPKFVGLVCETKNPHNKPYVENEFSQ
jgi:hypothetical protein